MVAVEVVATETAVPALRLDELAVRDVERIVLDREVGVALPAVRPVGDRHAHACVLAVTRRALLGMDVGARLGEPRLEEPVHRVAIFGPHVAALAFRVADGAKPEVDVSVLARDPVARDRLQLLARRRGEVLSRTQIASYVWDMNFDSDTNVVEVAIRRLRAKIDDGYESKLIHTVRGMGYVLDEELGDH